MPSRITPAAARRLAVQAVIVCVIALAAAVISFALMRNIWLGVIWTLLAGVASNLAWYYRRAAAAPRAADPVPGGAGTPE
ncbi:hypothetical protein [Streptomyces bohaiensis]|uniref:Secreted protein n=1 Tax=Streptomyces bohaiensis TaxID=1431344 RepID=A0ABX1CCM0_9ACTN|nr:hypothetical protein [Streptomyces bohaiensis]NJQ15873.1 hypothetical protein [Streptomyces bohaiensis]